MSTTNLIDYFNGFIGRFKFAFEILNAGEKAHRNIQAEKSKAAILLKENTASFNHDEKAVSAHNSTLHFHDSNNNLIINENKSL